MSLPENIIKAMDTDRLKRKYPVRFQIYALIPAGILSDLELRKVSNEMYENTDEIHAAIAEMLESETGEVGRYYWLTYLPVICKDNTL